MNDAGETSDGLGSGPSRLTRRPRLSEGSAGVFAYPARVLRMRDAKTCREQAEYCYRKAEATIRSDDKEGWLCPGARARTPKPGTLMPVNTIRAMSVGLVRCVGM